MLSLNPARYYRRRLSYVIPTGLLVNVAGVSFDAFLMSEPTLGWLRWDGAVSWSFNLAWAVVVGILVWGDLKQTA